MNRLHSISTIIFIIALSVYGYLQWQKSNEPIVQIVKPKDEPDFIATALSSSQYDEMGNLTHTISADKMSHYLNNTETIFQTPKYTLYPKNGGAVWHLSANAGRLGEDNILLLNDRVRLISEDKTSFISEIHGKSLNVDLTNNIITSEQTILLKGKDFTMYGSGFHVDINSTKMTLNEHVQTIYKKHAS